MARKPICIHTWTRRMSDDRLLIYELLWSPVQCYHGPRNRSAPAVTCWVILLLFYLFFFFFFLLLLFILFIYWWGKGEDGEGAMNVSRKWRFVQLNAKIYVRLVSVQYITMSWSMLLRNQYSVLDPNVTASPPLKYKHTKYRTVTPEKCQKTKEVWRQPTRLMVVTTWKLKVPIRMFKYINN